MSRSSWKGYYLSKEILKWKYKATDEYKPIKIWSRDSVIPSFLLDKKVAIHNGKEFKELLIQPNHLGYKFGEFSFTRQHGGHKNVKLKLAQQKKKKKTVSKKK